MGNYKKIVKKSVVISALAVFLAITFMGAVLGFEIDDVEDNYKLQPGDKIVGTFVIENTSYVNLKTDFEWISFSANSDLKTKNNVQGTDVDSNAAFVQYYIGIPANANVGIYRTAISISSGNNTKYLNIKIDIQNSLFLKISKFFGELNVIAKYLIWVIAIILAIIALHFLRKATLGDKSGK